jgi:Zn-dependent protease
MAFPLVARDGLMRVGLGGNLRYVSSRSRGSFFASEPYRNFLNVLAMKPSGSATRQYSFRGGVPTRFGLVPSMQSMVLRALSSQSNGNRPTGPNPPPRNRLTAGLATAGTGAAILFGKGKYVLGVLKLTKFASLGSMLVTVGTYSMFFGFPYAVGAVGLIAVHESGHALAMHRLGIPFSPMVFVPFMGAAVAMKKQPKDAYQEALVAFGGPYLGTAGAVGVNLAATATGSDLLFALSDFGYMINLFNMLPIGMMDGGRICGAFSPYAGIAGLGAGGALIYNDLIHNPIFYIIMLAGAWETFSRFYYPNSMPPNYYKITGAQRSMITAGYFGLVVFLFGAMSQNRKKLKSPEVLRQEQESGDFQVNFRDGTFG